MNTETNNRSYTIIDEEERKFDAVVTQIDAWYDRHTRDYCIQKLNKDGYQIGDSIRVGNKEDKEAVVRDLCEEYGLMYKKSTEAQISAMKKYQKNNTVQIKLTLNVNTDADILEQLDKVENRSGYIKDLIRKDIG